MEFRKAHSKGIRIKPNDTATSLSGEISLSSIDNKLKITTEVPADYVAQVYNVGDKVRYADGDKLNYICIQTTTGAEDPSDASFWEVYERTVVTEDQTQTLTNKTIDGITIDGDASGTAILDEDDMVSDSDTKLATQQSIKAYVDSQIASKDEASEITYDNTSSGLAATDVQAAVDEVETRVDRDWET